MPRNSKNGGFIMDTVLCFALMALCLLINECGVVAPTGTPTRQKLTIGVLTPYNSELGFCTSAALDQAVQFVKRNIPIAGVDSNFRLLISDSKCSGSTAVGKTADLRGDDNVNVIIGVPCTASAKSSAELSGFWKRPLLSWYAPDLELMNKTRFPTLVRVFPPVHKVIRPLMKLLDVHGWSKIGAVVDEESKEKDLWSLMANEINRRSKLQLLRTANCNERVRGCLSDIKDSIRVILLVVNSNHLDNYMTEAHKLGMTASEGYVFIHYYHLEGMKSPKELWYGPEMSWNNLILLNIKLPDYTAYAEFLENVFAVAGANYNPESGSNSTLCTSTSSTLAQVLSGYMFDTLVYYSMAKQYMVQQQKDWADFLLWANEPRKYNTKLQLIGKTGALEFDERGDRKAEYSVKHYQFGEWAELAVIDSDDRQAYKLHAQLAWNNVLGETPPDTPECGFDGSDCFDAGLVAGPVVGFILLVVLVVGGYCFYRRRSESKEIFDRSWLVNRGDIKFQKKPQLGGRQSSMSAGGGGGTLQKKKLTRMATKYIDMTMTAGSGSMLSFDMTTDMDSNIAVYKSQFVYVKKLARQFRSDRLTLTDLNTLYEMKADHVNNFIGAAADPDPVVLMAYCTKGSLMDVLANSDIKLDTMFILSFATDIARGMQFIHNSSLVSNGNLKSTNCVIDSRWVVKITDLGVVCPAESRMYDAAATAEDYYSRQLWTAPELLRLSKLSGKGTQKGDIYSFAIILQEMICRSTPYCHNLEFNELTAKDIIDLVKAGDSNGKVCRPLTFNDPQAAYGAEWRSVYASLRSLMLKCWEEDASLRPTFTYIKRFIKSLTDEGKDTLVDHMVKMLEKYADNLEELVEERTDELEQEKQKTENLLNSMLPRQVANKLKLGLPVEPESFDAVSIFFSDIVGFTTIASMSKPIEIVQLLNKLYTLFDEIIESYDVYKVETIGDAYMVCSGLPERIDDHAAHIACMALDFREAVYGFEIDHMPGEQLQLRIGLHCGPCVAGVVGTAMPRYCLFGDTVNMASRMESTGEALKIQCSTAMNHELMLGDYGFIMQKRGEIRVKGKGSQITYWLLKKEGGTPRNIRLQRTNSEIDLDHMEEIHANDSVSNGAPRRGSDWSYHTDQTESADPYVLLDLPDHTRNTTSPYSRDQQCPPHTESIRSIGDIHVDRYSDTGVSFMTGFSSPVGDDGRVDDSRNVAGGVEPTEVKSVAGQKTQQGNLMRTAFVHRAERIRRKSLGKVEPMGMEKLSPPPSAAKLPKAFTSPNMHGGGDTSGLFVTDVSTKSRSRRPDGIHTNNNNKPGDHHLKKPEDAERDRHKRQHPLSAPPNRKTENNHMLENRNSGAAVPDITIQDAWESNEAEVSV